MRGRLEAAGWPEAAADPTAPYAVGDRPGAFFAFTSNVDAHHFDCFAASEIRECHGNTELYQCARRRGCQSIWRAPLDFRFRVDRRTMLAPLGTPAAPEAPAKSWTCSACEGAGTVLAEPCPLCDGAGALTDDDDDDAGAPTPSAPCIGRVRGGGRPRTLRHMPGPAPDAALAGFG